MNRHLAYPLMAGRALLQRVLPERSRGVTAYFLDGIASRLDAAGWQLRHHSRTTCLLDVGCGRDLLLALTAAIRCGKRAIAFDVLPIADLALVNYTLSALGVATVSSLPELEYRYGVSYRVAHSLAGVTDVFDGVASTAVFEHIPEPDLRALAAHLPSRLPVDGVVTAEIDYRDHWSFLAPVKPDNFYHLSDAAFALVNPPRMFQNRLRHRDILTLFREQGFATIAEVTTRMDTAGLPTNPRFATYTSDELAVATALVAWSQG